MKYKLELDDYPFEGWAFLHFQSRRPSYVFADHLNRLYDYELMRLDDMCLDGTPWPFFLYHDRVGHTKYFLTERPVSAQHSPWQAGDKLLIVKGENAEFVCERIYDDFTGAGHANEGDLLAEEHAAYMDELLSDFTVATMIDFESDGLSRKGQKELDAMRRCCEDILSYIDRQHLDLSMEERMRLSMNGNKK